MGEGKGRFLTIEISAGYEMREIEKGEHSCWDIPAKSHVPNWAMKRDMTNAQVLRVFFFGVGLVVPQADGM